ncbi:hypothetical protein [Klebsiella michiganensis]|uniref:hypothetical protein n=1 Tax=Klebsiella michiganensis TaxID=1134687 RepID=UPI0036D401A9
MAYATTNPPALLQDRIGGGGAAWSYSSSDLIAAVTAANYITNGKALGMKVGDAVVVYNTTLPMSYSAFVSAVTASGAMLKLATATASA